jgi:hypothetical protein
MDLDKVSLSQYYTLRIAGQGSRDQGNQSKGLDVDEVFESCHQPSRQRMRRGWLRMRESQRVEMAVCRSVCSELKDHVFCSRVLFCVLSSQRGSSRVYFHDVSLMYTCVESAHGVEGGALGQRT